MKKYRLLILILAMIFGTEQGNTFFQGRDGLLFFIARRAIVDGVNKKCYNYYYERY